MLIYLIIGLITLLLTVISANQTIALSFIAGYFLAGIVLALQAEVQVEVIPDEDEDDG